LSPKYFKAKIKGFNPNEHKGIPKGTVKNSESGIYENPEVTEETMKNCLQELSLNYKE
jgi:hypothetical protein